MQRVSVILPTYNGAKFIGRAIASVLNQSEKDFELIIVDDGSTDNTAPIANEFAKKDSRVRLIGQNMNQGIQAALNAGLKAATGEYVARIDDDDEWLDAQKLQKQLEFFQKNPEYVLVGTGIVVKDENSKELFRFLNPETDGEIRSKILYRNCFSHSSVMFKRAAVMEFGGYNDAKSVLHAEDYDLWLKLGTKGKLANLPIYATALTQRPSAISSKYKIQQFRNQLAITKQFKHSDILKNVGMSYSNYLSSRLKSRFRLWVYSLFSAFTPRSVQNWILKYYKQA